MSHHRPSPRSRCGSLPARFETLESRVLFSADPAGVGADFESNPTLVVLAAPAEPPVVPVVDLTDRRLLATEPGARNELIVVDARVAEPAALLAALALDLESGRRFEVLVLDQASDGIDALDAALRTDGPRFDAVHVLAHGVDGGMQLGSAMLSLSTLVERGAQFQHWRELLSDEADLLFYACDLAASEAGMRWLEELALLTGADIAASDDATGHAGLGGDWELEFRTGLVDGVLAAAGDTWRHALGANQTTAGVQSQPSVAVDGAGNRIVVWQSEAQDGSGWGVYARRYDAAGTALGAEFLINQTTAGDQFDPDVVMDANGAFIVTWTSLGQDGDGATQGNVYARRFAADGTAIGAEFRVNTTVAGDQREAAIGIDNDGEFMVAWASDGQDGSGWGVYARKYGGGGAPLTGEVAINTTTANDQRSPDIVGDDYGDFIFAWQSAGQDGSGWGIYRAFYANNGNFLGGEKRVSNTTAGDQTDPAIGVDTVGNWLITWTSAGQDGAGAGIYGQYVLYSGNGGNETGEFLVNTTTAGDQQDSAVGYDDHRNFVVTWTSSGQEGDAPEHTNVYAQVLDQVGNRLQPYGGECRINAYEAGSQTHAAVAMGRDGQYVIVWSGAGSNDGTGIDVQAFANPFGNSAPSVVLANSTLNHLEGDAAANVDASLTVADADSNSLVSATVQFDTGFVVGEDLLQYTDMLGIAGSFNAATGVLSLTGTTTVAKYQQALRTVAYFNAAGEPTSGQRRISVTVNDGVYTGSDTRSIDVQSVNDAPVLSGANDLVAIAEDASAHGGTLVSALIAGRVADADVGAVRGIAVVAVDDTHGTWQYTTDAGATWSDFGVPGAASARLLSAAAGSAVRFVPHANWHGTVAAGLTFHAWDASTGISGATGDTTLNGGSSAYSTASASASIVVAAVNDAPSGADATFVVLEDASRTLSAADFGFADAADTPSHAFDAIRIAGLPAAGTLTRDGVAVSIGQIVTRADIDAGKLVYAPAGNGNGAGYASFRFQVCDTGGTSNGGVDLDSTPDTLTFDVTPVNDRPVNHLPPTQYVGYNAALVFAGANGNAITVSDPDAGSNAVELTLLAANGTVSLAGTAGLSFTVGDGTGDALMIFNGSLAALDGATFTPTLNFFGAATLVVGVNDLGASGGLALTDDDTLAIVVAGPLALNVLADAYAVGEDAVLTAGSVLANDSDPLLGTMSVSEINGVAAAVGAVHTLPSGALLTMNADGTFQYDPNGAYAALAQGTTALDTFTYMVSSTSGRSGVGSVTVTIVGANDAPVLTGANDLLPTHEDALGNSGTLVSALIAGQVTATDALAARGIAVTAVDQTQGAWQYSIDGGNVWSSLGAATIANARLLLADAGTYVRFVPATNWNGVVAAGLTFRAWGATSGAAGGTADTSVNGAQTAFSSATASASIVVQAVNDAPTGTDRVLTLAEDGIHTFTAADFGYGDALDAGAHGLDAVRIVSTPAAGVLRKAGWT